MKRIIFYLLTVILLATSCENELIQNPNSVKVSDNFYSNETEIEEAINATYASLQFSGIYNTATQAIGELPGEDAYDETPANDGGVYGMLDDFNVIAQSSLIQHVWKDSYIGIQRANIVLNRITSIDFKDEATKDSRIGEMKFIRGLLYFNLVRIFGDVPLVIDEIKNPQNAFGQIRTPKNEVYTQIENDLTDAINTLPNRNDTNKVRVVKTAAQALMGEVELTLGNYAEAQKYLLDVVNSNTHKLININDVFAIDNQMNEEIIFAVQFSSGLNSNSEGSDAYRMFNPTARVVGNMTGTKGHGVLKPDFYNLYSDSDSRKDVYVGVLDSGLGFNNKIAPPTTVIEDAESDWVVLRYANVLLMLSEIDNELGNTSEALVYLNMIRNRATIGNYTGTTDKTSLFNEIDLQRRKELVWEGHRWFDLLRQGRAQSVLNITDPNKLLMPIPASQIATDPALKQNPGY